MSNYWNDTRISSAKKMSLSVLRDMVNEDRVDNKTIFQSKLGFSFYFSIESKPNQEEYNFFLAPEKKDHPRVFKKGMTYARILHDINIKEWDVKSTLPTQGEVSDE